MIMIEKILIEAGFVKGKTFAEGRFVKPPKSAYCVWSDEVDGTGADDRLFVLSHSYTIELYSLTPDPNDESKIEKVLQDCGFAYTKNSRYWIQEESLYQVIYTFDYIEKIRR